VRKGNYCEWHWLSGQNCEDGPEIEIIRREQENWFLDWVDDLLNRRKKAYEMAEAFIRRWRKP